MKRWLIRISGAQTDLEDVVHWFPTGSTYAFTEETVTYVASDRFRIEDGFSDVFDEAKAILTVWHPAIELQSPGFQCPTIDAVVEESEDGTRKAFVLAEARAQSRFRARARTDSVGPTQAQLIVEQSQSHPILGDVLVLWGMPNRTWSRLYRIMEELERHLGVTVNVKGLCTPKERNRFKASANNAAVSGFESRHSGGKYDPPVDPMTIEEATAFVRDLILDCMRLH